MIRHQAPRTRFFFFFGFFFFLQLQLLGEEKKNIILIGWDGAQRDHVNDCLKKGDLPVLNRISSEGRYVPIDIFGTTDTKAGWSQILTGYTPEITGVYSNRKYHPIPKGLSIGERLKDSFGSEFVAAYIIGKKGHVDADPPRRVKMPLVDNSLIVIGKSPRRRRDNQQAAESLLRQPKFIGGTVIEENGIRYIDVPGKPYYYTQDGVDVFENGLRTNKAVALRSMELLEKYQKKNFFFFIHFAEVDHQGHTFGENSPEYTDALRSCDEWTGKIIEKLKQLNVYQRTLIYITADHGFDEGEQRHRNAPAVFLATNDTCVQHSGTRTDIAPTILARMGIPIVLLKPPLSGKSLLEK